jgi:CBS domain-containing protein/mannitol/fructose-specific phosphotransferase system IIA component (Ntr-type)
MDLLDLLPPEHVVVPLRAPDLPAAIGILARRLHESGVVDDLGALEARIRDQPPREIIGVTDEVVLPHYRSDSVNTLGLALGVAPDPIPVEPGGDAAVRVVALILAPPEAATLYLQATSTLARLFRQGNIVDLFARQPDPASLRALPQLQNLRIQHSLMVRDVMTQRIHSVPPDATVRRTLDLMLRRKLHAVPVVGEAGEVLGMVTDSDLMRALLPQIPRAGESDRQEAAPQDRPVRDIMTRSVLCVSEELGVSEVASMMLNKDVEQLPVVNAGSIAGMVYRRDIIRKLFGRA